MSGDLISKQALLKEIKDKIIPEKYGTTNAVLDVMGAVLRVIGEQTSAYDVEEVIHQLEDAIMPTPEHRHKFCGTVQPEYCVKYDNCEDCMAEKMIEIVESGGTAVGQKGERE